MIRLTRNTFEKLRNTDANKNIVQPNQYIEAHNVEITGDGNYYALQNFKGTSEVQTVINAVASGVEVLGAFRTDYTISGSSKKCITFFTQVSTTFKIWCYDTEADVLYEIYEENDYSNSNPAIDAVLFPENGTDILYFTDNYNEIRQLRCEIPNPYSANFLSKYDLSLLRGGANGTVEALSVDSGGSLLSGTYQFAYRMVDPDTKRFTKWSSLCSPVHVYNAANSNAAVYSGIGLPTTRKISLRVTPSWEEIDFFGYLQVAVVENVGPTKPTEASLLEIQEILSTELDFDYKANTRIGTIPIEDIVVDLAQIDHVKTINVKDNRLFAGNIQYADLTFDNGNPTVTSASFVRQNQGGSTRDPFSSEIFSSQKVGYFRGEVYRFGIVYTDEKGNKSPVYPLDFTGKISGHTISNAPDVKFPDRSTSNQYTLFDTSNRIQSLGLQLTGLTNHPTWARSFEIVRVKRKKNIQFQTPVIPMSTVEGIGAMGNYPTRPTPVREGEIDVDDAQPQTTSRVLVPKNLYWPEQRRIVRRNSAFSSGGNGAAQGEASLERSTEGHQFSMIFPSDTMYTSAPYQFSGAEKLDFVDYALLKLNNAQSTPTKSVTHTVGDDANTNVSGNFYALSDQQYFFDSAWTGKSILSAYRNNPIVEAETFETFGQPASIAGSSIMDYDALDTQNYQFGYKPTIQRCAVVKLGNTAPDINNAAKVFAAGTYQAYTSGGQIMAGGSMYYESTVTNKYLPEYSSWSSNQYVQAVGVANVVLGLGDDRYGDLTTVHEYISTGAKYTFSEAEVATLEGGGSVSKDITVFGGDCFVSSHLFKVTDSSYSVVSQGILANTDSEIDTQIAKWEKVYIASSWIGTGLFSSINRVLKMPVAVEAASQYVQVILESEYHGEVRDYDTVEVVAHDNGIPIFNVSTKEAMRTPLTYRYNINLSQQNDQKVFFPKPTYTFEQSYFGARVAYSDLKIYNSESVGFDTFKVADFYDLEEKLGNLTKLALSGDNLLAIQERGLLYLPVGANQIEQADAGTLAVRTAEVIGSPIVIDSERGGQHLRGIVETGNIVFIPDNINKAIYAVAGQDFKVISDMDNETTFRDFFSSTINEKDLIGIYEPIRKEYWIVDKQNYVCHVFSDRFGGWVGEYDFASDAKVFAGVNVNQKFYLIGKHTDLVIAQMYEGTVNQLFGKVVEPSVTFCINPDSGVSKTLDNVVIVASERLDTLDIDVERETEQGVQSMQQVTLDSISIEGNYRVKTLRDSSDARLRGMYGLATIKWKDIRSAVSQVFTKYRHSSRSPF